MAQDFFRSCISPITRQVISAFCCRGHNKSLQLYYHLLTCLHQLFECHILNPKFIRAFEQADEIEALCMCWQNLVVAVNFNKSRGSSFCFSLLHGISNRVWNLLQGFRDSCNILVMPRDPVPELEEFMLSVLGVNSAPNYKKISMKLNRWYLFPASKTIEELSLLTVFWITDNWI